MKRPARRLLSLLCALLCVLLFALGATAAYESSSRVHSAVSQIDKRCMTTPRGHSLEPRRPR